MNSIHRLALGAVTAAVLVGLGGCGGLSRQDKHRHRRRCGRPWRCRPDGRRHGRPVGGAVIGGVIGHEVGKPEEKKKR